MQEEKLEVLQKKSTKEHKAKIYYEKHIAFTTLQKESQKKLTEKIKEKYGLRDFSILVTVNYYKKLKVLRYDLFGVKDCFPYCYETVFDHKMQRGLERMNLRCEIAVRDAIGLDSQDMIRNSEFGFPVLI